MAPNNIKITLRTRVDHDAVASVRETCESLRLRGLGFNIDRDVVHGAAGRKRLEDGWVQIATVTCRGTWFIKSSAVLVRVVLDPGADELDCAA